MAVAGLVLSMVTLGVIGAPSVTAAPTALQDINPDVSTSSDADATTGGRVNGLASEPGGDPDVYYAASEWGGLFKSLDGGDTWRHLNAHHPNATYDVEVDPGNTGTVYAASFYDGRVVTQAGINVSRDGGATWTHPASANPAAGSPCSAATRQEPSAFQISIQPDAFATVFVGTNCGVARSTDSGATWTFLDPTGSGTSQAVWDVAALGGQSVAVCGNDGYFTSPDNGANWTQATTGPPSGRCSLASSPDENYVLFAAASDNNWWESDDGGVTWTNRGTPDPNPQGRIPFVATNDRAGTAFDLWFGDVSLFRAGCTTPGAPAPGGAARCPTTFAGPFTRSVGGHDDVGAILFDPAQTVDACPTVFSSDGGMHVNTDTGADCQNPNWSRANVGMHALWLFGMSGFDAAGTDEHLAFGVQDDGLHVTTDAGATPPTWVNPRCCDVFDTAVDTNRLLYTRCCFNTAPATRLFTSPPDGSGETQITTPNGAPSSFRPTDALIRFGDRRYAFIDGGQVFVTTDVTAAGPTWTQLGAGSTPANACGISVGESTAVPGTPVFYLQAGPTTTNCRTIGGDTLWRYSGISPGGTWTRIDNNGMNGGIGLVAVDRSNPNRLIVSNSAAAGPRMMRSNDGGQSWTAMPALDTFMTGSGTFRATTTAGPTNFTGFGGYQQPTLAAFDPEDPNTIIAGGHDSGVFLSSDNGASWALMTDPNTPEFSGLANLTQPRFAYFDHEPGGVSIVIGTQGRGVWRLTASTADLTVTKTPRPDPAIAGEQLFYDVTISNTGPDDAPAVTVTDQLPPEVDYVTSTDNCTESPAGSGTLTCPIGAVASGASKTFTIKVFVHPDAIVGTGPRTIDNRISVLSSGALDANPGDNSAVQKTIVEDRADLVVQKLCKPDTAINAGATIHCTVFVDNLGPSFARQVVLDDQVLSSSAVSITGVTSSQGSCGAVVNGAFSCQLGTLANASPTTQGRATVEYDLTSAEGQDVNNVATVRAATPDPNTTNNRSTVNLTVTAVADIRVEKSAVPSPVVAGTAISWTVTVFNDVPPAGGPSTARNVVLTDDVPAGVTITSVSGTGCTAGVPGNPSQPTRCGLGTMAVGSSRVVTINATVLPGTTGILSNDARVGSDTFDPDNSDNLVHSDTTVKGRATLVLSKTHSAPTSPPIAGRPLDYTLSLRNDGPSLARNVVLRDQLPNDTTFTGYEIALGSATCALAVDDPHRLICQGADMAPADVLKVKVHTTINSSTAHNATLLNTVTATSSTPNAADGANSETANDSVQVVRSADLRMVKTSSLDYYKPSATVDYTLTVTNLGPSDHVATTMVDTLPPAKIAPYVTDSGNGSCTFNAGSNTLTCQVPALAAGASYAVNVYVRVKGSKGTITNSVVVNGQAASPDPDLGNNASTRQVLIKGGI